MSQVEEPEIIRILEKIRRLRVEKKISVLDLANRADISHSYIFYLESKKKTPTLTTLLKITRALGVELKDVL